MANYYRPLIKLLRDDGFEFLRQGRGDHEVWWHPVKRVAAIVDRGSTSRHTANAILKDAGLPKAF
ncbi:MAG TPA: type II toxin-antitoxin system HicA family toxin [Ancylobacter sp.]